MGGPKKLSKLIIGGLKISGGGLNMRTYKKPSVVAPEKK